MAEDLTTEELEQLFCIELDTPKLSEDQLAIKKVFGLSDRELTELAIGKDAMSRITGMLSNLQTPHADQKLIKKVFHDAPVIKTPKKRKKQKPSASTY